MISGSGSQDRGSCTSQISFGRRARSWRRLGFLYLAKYDLGPRLTHHTEAKPGSASEGTWDSIHVFEAIDRARVTQYNLTSTIILSLSTSGSGLGDMDLSGNMTRQVEQELPAESDEQQIANIGKLVEDMELKMRNLLQEVYFGKAKDVVGDLRSVGSLSEAGRDRDAQREIIGSMRR